MFGNDRMETPSTEVTSIWRRNDIEKFMWKTHRYFIDFESRIHVELMSYFPHGFAFQNWCDFHELSTRNFDVELMANWRRCAHWNLNSMTSWWNFCVAEVKEKKYYRFLLSNAFSVYNLRVIEHFDTWNLCEYLLILSLDVVQKSSRISSPFDIVRIFFLSGFLGHLSQVIYLKLFEAIQYRILYLKTCCNFLW